MIRECDPVILSCPESPKPITNAAREDGKRMGDLKAAEAKSINAALFKDHWKSITWFQECHVRDNLIVRKRQVKKAEQKRQ